MVFHNRQMLTIGVLSLVGALAGASLVFAQPKPGKEPSSTHIFPAGARRGSTVAVRVGTECVPPGARFFVTGRKVTAPMVLGEEVVDAGEPSPRRVPTQIPITYPREWISQIEVAPDAPLGPVYWRLSCAQGGTGSRPFIVGDLPEFIESESNSLPVQAETVTLPVTINGQINGERDVDYFLFTAKAGQVVTADVLCARLGSRLDPIVEVLDASGERLATQQIYVGSDPVLAFLVPADGNYLLQVANVTHHGDPSHVYRINLSTRPYVQYAFPAGGQAGEEREITLYLLSGTSEPKAIRRTVKFPQTSAAEFDFDDPETGCRIPLAVSQSVNRIEQEPNDTPEAAMRLAVPVTIDGRFLTTSDADWFRLTAEKDERLTILARAMPASGPAMPNLRLTDAKGKSLAVVRSVESTDGLCQIEWQAPATGEYLLGVEDLQRGARGGSDLIYRLTIDHQRPDFSLSVASDSLNVVQEGKTTLQVEVRRFGGFDGAIDLSFENLPAGVTAEGLQVPVGKTSAKVTVSAAADVPAADATLTVVGRAGDGESALVRTLAARHLGTDCEGVSVGFATLDHLQLTVCHKPVFRLFCSEAYQYAHRGSVYPYLMEVERLNGFDGEIILQIGDRQNRDLDGIEFFPAVVAPGTSQAWLPIYLPETMHINVQSQSQLYTQGFATFTDQHNRQQSVLVLSEKRNMLRTLPPVVKLSAVDAQLAGERGSTASCRLHLERTTNFPGPMKLVLIDPADEAGIQVETLQIAAGQTEIDVPVQIGQDAKTGKPIALRFRASGKLDDRIEIITEAFVTLNVR